MESFIVLYMHCVLMYEDICIILYSRVILRTKETENTIRTLFIRLQNHPAALDIG